MALYPEVLNELQPRTPLHCNWWSECPLVTQADIRAHMRYSVGARLMASRRRARSNTRWALR
jgi:hypothetical protein